jgi:ribosomal-protein-alanine N-acetyltransferase
VKSSPPKNNSPFALTTLDNSCLDEIMEIENASFSQPWTRDLFFDEILNPRVLSIGARDADNLLAGYLFMFMALDEVSIHTFAVRPDLRRQGIAAALLSRGLLLAKKKGAQRAHLEVRRGNLAARTLYEKFGFEIVGRRPNYYLEPLEDALLMSARLI